MKLSLWILCDALADLAPETDIAGGEIGISGVRLFQPGAAEEDYALYLGASDDFFSDGDARITLRSRGDTVRLATTDLVSVFNRIQDAFGHYGKWYSACESAIASGCTLSELLGMATDVLRAPILIVDAAQVQVAHSSDLSAVETAEDWENLMSQKSISVEKIRQFNQIYKDTFYYTGVFPIPAGVFPTKSHCKHILVGGERLATVIMKTLDRDHTPGQLHLFELFTRLVESWIFSAADRDDLFRLSSYFARTLGGDTESLPVLQRQLSLFGWVDEETQTTYALGIPGGTSFLADGSFDTVYPGLNDYPVEDQPGAVNLIFQSYHIMVAMFGAIVLVLILAALVYAGKLKNHKWPLYILMIGWIAPILAIEFGWVVAEVGRQPWIVWGELRTADAISEAVPAGQVIATLVGFFAVYALIYIAWIRSVVKTVKKGPDVYLSGSEGRNGEAPAVSDGGRAAQGSADAAKEVGTR